MDIDPQSNFYTVSTFSFHKYSGEIFEVTNFMPHFYMFVLTISNVKFPGGDKGQAQLFGIFYIDLQTFL